MQMGKVLIYLFSFFCLVSTVSAATLNVNEGSTEAGINQLVSSANPGDVINLGDNVYTISSPIYLKSDISIIGNGAVIYVPEKSDFNSDNEAAMIQGEDVSNVKISGIHFKGPADSLADIHDDGQEFYGGHGEFHNAMRFTGCSNVEISDCSCELLLSDFARVMRSEGFTIHDNVIDTSGHDGCQFFRSNDLTVYNNYFHVFINCGVRVSSCTDAVISCNTFTSPESSGWNGVQVQGESTGITVEKNVFSEMGDNYGVTGYENDGSGSTIKGNAGYDISAGLVNGLGNAYTDNNKVYTSKQDWGSLGVGYTGTYTPVTKDDNTIDDVDDKPVVSGDGMKGAALQMTATLENSVTDLQFNYAENINDGRGITFGCIGFCTGTYDGNVLIKHYTELNPDNNLAKYIPALNEIDSGNHNMAGGDGNDDITGLDGFTQDVQNCDDPLFKQAQLDMLDELYWDPAMKLCEDAGVTLPLTKAYVYDMSVRHGPDGAEEIMKQAGSVNNYSSETEYLSKIISIRNTELQNEGLGDVNRNEGYVSVLDSGNYNLVTPYTFIAYGEEFTIDGDLDVNVSNEAEEPVEDPTISDDDETDVTPTNETKPVCNETESKCNGSVVKDETIVINQEKSSCAQSSCTGNVTMTYIEPIIIEQPNSIMKVYTLPANCTPIFFEGDTMIAKQV